MRVLHINGNYLDSYLHQELVAHLDNIGIENTVYVPIHEGHKGIVDSAGDAQVYTCFSKWDRFNFYKKQKKIIRTAERKFDIPSFDCIQAQTLFTDGNAAYELSKKYNIPFVVTVRNTDINVFFKYMLYLRGRGNRILSEASRIVFISEAYKKNVLQRYVRETFRGRVGNFGKKFTTIVKPIADKDDKKVSRKDIIRNKATKIPNGIDKFWLDNIYSSRDYDEAQERFVRKQLRLIYAGNIEKNKNIELTTEAVKLLRLQGWDATFTVVGSVKDERLYKSLENQIRYIPKCPKEELIGQYRKADILVMPSHAETFGLVYAEAMSQGLPVIYTREQGFDGQFLDGEVGYSVSDKDASELAERIVKIVGVGSTVSTSNTYKTMSENAMRGCRKFDWDKVAREYARVYVESCKKEI